MDDLLRESVLDRLLDDEPDRETDPSFSRAEQVIRIKNAVRRDLEDLLNTRYRCHTWPPRFPQLTDSLVNYGLPDFTAASLNVGEETEILVEAIKNAIRLFEPRLSDVSVEPIGPRQSIDRTFRFRIAATLITGPDEVPVQFNSRLESTTGQMSVD